MPIRLADLADEPAMWHEMPVLIFIILVAPRFGILVTISRVTRSPNHLRCFSRIHTVVVATKSRRLPPGSAYAVIRHAEATEPYLLPDDQPSGPPFVTPPNIRPSAGKEARPSRPTSASAAFSATVATHREKPSSTAAAMPSDNKRERARASLPQTCRKPAFHGPSDGMTSHSPSRP